MDTLLYFPLVWNAHLCFRAGKWVSLPACLWGVRETHLLPTGERPTVHPRLPPLVVAESAFHRSAVKIYKTFKTQSGCILRSSVSLVNYLIHWLLMHELKLSNNKHKNEEQRFVCFFFSSLLCLTFPQFLPVSLLLSISSPLSVGRDRDEAKNPR